MAMRARFTGLGHLGNAIAGRLKFQPPALGPRRLEPRHRKRPMGMGMEVAKSPADLISKVPVVFINHFDSNAVGGCHGE